MEGSDRVYSPPRWRVTRWLADPGPDVPADIRAALIASLFGSSPVFIAGVLNTLVVSAAIAFRIPTAPFIAWFVFEALVCATRVIVLLKASRAAAEGRDTPTDLYLLLALCWGFGVGYGACVSIASGDWIAATLACISAAAMVGGICFRNFGAPRLASSMILLSLGPCVVGVIAANEPLMYIIFLQMPMYVAAMTTAAFRLNRMWVATMRAERENDRRARHDPLTGLLNRAGLFDAFKRRAAADPHERLALLYLDLDGFKVVNDRYGHAVGDRLLQAVARDLGAALRDTDIVARVGGDEFVVLAAASDDGDALSFGDALSRAIAKSYALDDDLRAEIGVSIGVALAPQHGDEMGELLAAADAALYHAKTTGKARCVLASPEESIARLREMAAKARPAAASRTRAA